MAGASQRAARVPKRFESTKIAERRAREVRGAPAHAQVARADRPSESAFWGLRGLFQRGRARGVGDPLSVSRPFRAPHRLVRRLEVGGYASCASHRH